MISGIDENVKMCILRSFADDTREAKGHIQWRQTTDAGRPEVNIQLGQKNKMEFNAKKNNNNTGK